MVFPPQRPRNFHPMRMERMPNNFFSQGYPLNKTTPTNKIQSMVQSFLGNSPTSTIPTSGTGGISKTLGNIQQILQVVEKTAPIVKQYGPMVKNLPAMLQMMKALKDADSLDSEDANSSTESIDQGQHANNDDEEKVEIEQSPESEESFNVDKRSGESIPKLYI